MVIGGRIRRHTQHIQGIVHWAIVLYEGVLIGKTKWNILTIFWQLIYDVHLIELMNVGGAKNRQLHSDIVYSLVHYQFILTILDMNMLKYLRQIQSIKFTQSEL